MKTEQTPEPPKQMMQFLAVACVERAKALDIKGQKKLSEFGLNYFVGAAMMLEYLRETNRLQGDGITGIGVAVSMIAIKGYSQIESLAVEDGIARK